LEVSFLFEDFNFTENERKRIFEEKNTYQTRVPEVIIRDGININEGMIRVYQVILSFVNLSEEGKLLNNIIHPSIRKMKALSGMENDKLLKCIEELEEVLLLRVVRNQKGEGRGRGSHNYYQLLQIPEFVYICSAFCDLKRKPTKTERKLFKEELIKAGYYEKAAKESKPLLYLLDSPNTTRNGSVPLMNDDVIQFSNYMVNKKFPTIFSMTTNEIENLLDSEIGSMVSLLISENKSSLKRKGILFETSQKDSYLKGIIAFYKTHKKSPNSEELKAIDQVLVIKDINPKHVAKATQNLKKSELPFTYDFLLKEAERIRDMKQEVGMELNKKRASKQQIKRKTAGVERDTMNFLNN
jgi:hypothetical protein